jgi:hypothetical protein
VALVGFVAWLALVPHIQPVEWKAATMPAQ